MKSPSSSSSSSEDATADLLGGDSNKYGDKVGRRLQRRDEAAAIVVVVGVGVLISVVVSFDSDEVRGGDEFDAEDEEGSSSVKLILVGSVLDDGDGDDENGNSIHPSNRRVHKQKPGAKKKIL